MKGLFCAVGSPQPSSRILGAFWILLGSAAVGDGGKSCLLERI